MLPSDRVVARSPARFPARLRRATAAVALAAVLATTAAAPARAQFAVYDNPNHIENIAQTIQSILAVLQRVEQIRQLYDQLRWMAAQIERLEDPGGREVASLLFHLGVLMQQGEALVYSLEDLERRFRETYPGPVVAEDLPAEDLRRVRTALDTYFAVLRSSQRVARNFVPSQQTLGAMKSNLMAAEGNREVTQAAGLLTAFHAEETSKLLQQVTALVNLQAVHHAGEIGREAAAEATFLDALDRARRPVLRYDGSGAPPLVPADLPRLPL
jgi:P-type conjugative transfer protein TrbJ